MVTAQQSLRCTRKSQAVPRKKEHMQQSLEAFYALSHLLQAIREFFTQRGLMEVMAPPMVPHPGMEPHIHPFGVYDVKSQQQLPYYLHTSPEFFMKHLLSLGAKNIFTLCYCYRSEPKSETHRPQFVMLEWYRSQVRYEKIMQDCKELIPFCTQYLAKQKINTQQLPPLQLMTVQALFKQFLDFDILEYLDKEKLAKLVAEKFPHLPSPQTSNDRDLWHWDDYFFLLFLNEIEPKLKQFPALIVYEYPYQLSALSTLKSSDPRVCERFELYIHGIEIANCFNELTDINEQKQRFIVQKNLKQTLYGYELGEPTLLYNALERGLPSSSGIALGVERLLKALTGIDNPFWDSVLPKDSASDRDN